MSNLRAASANFRVYSDVMLRKVEALIDTDDNGLDSVLSTISQFATVPHNYFLAQSLISRLVKEPGGYALRRISKELENAAREHLNAELIRNIRNVMMDTPLTVLQALRTGQPQPGEVTTLYRACMSESPLDPVFLRDPDLLDYLLKNVFVPKANQNIEERADLKEKYMYVLAYASSAMKDQHGKIDTSRVEETFEILKELQAITSRKGATGSDLMFVLGMIWKNNSRYIDTPMASMALIHWIRYLIRETPFYEKHYYQREVPIPHYLLEEIAERHEAQRPHVFGLYREVFEATTLNLTREVMTLLRFDLLDRMAYLVRIDFALPVMRYLVKNQKMMREKLMLRFTSKVLDLIKEPYSAEFYENAMILMEPLARQLDQAKKDKFRQFLANAPTDLSDPDRVRGILQSLDFAQEE